jgi:DNA recombination protein RmuC
MLTQISAVLFLILLVVALLSWSATFFFQRKKILELQGINSGTISELATLKERLQSLNRANELVGEFQQIIKHLEATLAESNIEYAKMSSALEHEKTIAREKLALLQEAKDEMANRFKVLAGEIFEDKSRKFTEQNQTNLKEILEPLREKIKAFETKVDNVYEKDSKERVSLQTEIKNLALLNAKMGEDAVNLTRALKGDGRVQGAWGEYVLQRILESSNMEKGREYEIQQSFEHEGGDRRRPDVIVHLPDNKQLIIDSKVSLTAYEKFASAKTEEEREQERKNHVLSIRSHIKGLSEKRYQSLPSINSVDFTMLFIAIEPAFMLALTSDPEILIDAFNRNVLLVGPSTLLATMRTIACVWRQERQNRNVAEIAKIGGQLYDKFVGFIEDLEDIGKKLASAQKSYDDAKTKLSSGRGNLISQTTRIKRLGAQTEKQIPGNLIATALDEDQLSLPDPDLSHPLEEVENT